MLAHRIMMAGRRAYADEVIADSPVAYWKLDETSGTTAADSSGNGNTGTYGSGVSLDQPPLIITGKSIAATAPSASDPVVDAPDIAASTVLSAELWLKASAPPASNRLILGKVLAGYSAPWLVWLNSNGTITVQLRYQNSSSGQASATSPASVADGNRHQVGFEWDRSGDQKIHLYVDGAQVAESAAWNQTIWAGASHRTQVYQVGSDVIAFDEVSVYLSYLTAARWAAHYNAGA